MKSYNQNAQTKCLHNRSNLKTANPRNKRKSTKITIRIGHVQARGLTRIQKDKKEGVTRREPTARVRYIILTLHLLPNSSKHDRKNKCLQISQLLGHQSSIATDAQHCSLHFSELPPPQIFSFWRAMCSHLNLVMWLVLHYNWNETIHCVHASIGRITSLRSIGTHIIPSACIIR